MLFRPFAMILTAGIAASLFMPWITTPFGQTMVPYDMLSQAGGNDISRLPGEVLAFMGSFLLAAVLTVTGLLGWFPKIMGVTMGAYPFALVGYLVLKANQTAQKTFGGGFSWPGGADFDTMMRMMREVVGIGIWVYFGCALVLLIVALFDPGKSSSR